VIRLAGALTVALVAVASIAATGRAAHAQIPTIDPSGRAPAAPAPAPAAPAPAPQPIVIPIGPDGQPLPTAPSSGGTAGWYYDDSAASAAGDADGGDASTFTGTVPELHVVRSGDTLWDLCWYYFNDPWQWPKIWSYNPAITNPHWIYPGDLVRVVPRGMTVSSLPADPEAGPGTTPGTGSSLGAEPAPARRFDVKLRQIAFVENDALKSPMKIDGAVEEKEMLASGDGVYVSYPDNRPPKVGQRYSVYSVGNTVKHPRGGAVVGAYVRILGTVEIQSVKKGKVARGVILNSTFEIERGALVGPLVVELKTVPPARPTVDAQGTIIALLERDQLIGEGEVVFIDLGEKSGLEVGNRMYVVRRGDARDGTDKGEMPEGQDDRRFPARALGEVLIVDVGRKVSIGMVTLAVQEMGIGDLVMMQKAP
jgi:hypothetical protein